MRNRQRRASLVFHDTPLLVLPFPSCRTGDKERDVISAVAGVTVGACNVDDVIGRGGHG